MHVKIEGKYFLIVDKSNFFKLDESTSISDRSTCSNDVPIAIGTINEGAPHDASKQNYDTHNVT